MSQGLYFWVSSLGARSGRRFAVPVHLVDDTKAWPQVRALAGRRAGHTFTIVRTELYRSVPRDARLVPGSRAIIEQYGTTRLPEAEQADRLRQRLVDWRGRLTQRQLENAFREMMAIAEHLRSRTQSDPAWRYFDQDLEFWARRDDTAYWGEEDNRRGWRLLLQMLDLVRGVAERYTPEPASVDEATAAYARAVAAERHAEDLASRAYRGVMQARPEVDDLPYWREVADAYEVAEDAWREAGDNVRADRASWTRTKILDSIRASYGPRRRRRS